MEGVHESEACPFKEFSEYPNGGFLFVFGLLVPNAVRGVGVSLSLVCVYTRAEVGVTHEYGGSSGGCVVKDSCCPVANGLDGYGVLLVSFPRDPG